jgi:hypothetical protein
MPGRPGPERAEVATKQAQHGLTVPLVQTFLPG